MAADLQKKGYVAKTVGIKLRYDDFRIATRDQTVQAYTDDARMLRKIAGLCLKRVPLAQPLRLLGVRASALAKAGDPAVLQANQAAAQAGQGQGAIKKVVTYSLF